MIVILETIDRQAEYRDFFFLPDTIEEAFDTISAISKCCLLIREAHLIEDSKWIKLPVGVFDGQSFSEPIAKLEMEWRRLLEIDHNL